MTADVIDGKALAATLHAQVTRQVDGLKRAGIVPGLAVVLVGQDAASEVYVRSKRRLTEEVGMISFAHALPAETPERELLALVDRLNEDPQVHGILVQLPLPRHMDSRPVINAIDPAKDVDGFHVSNVGLLGTGQKSIVPCTPLGCLMMLRIRLPSLRGLDALVVGRSNIVGKPMAHLLLDAGCTVTIAHSLTRDLPELCRRAEVLVAAVGRPELIRGDWIRPGATIVDVGINRVERDGAIRLVGDVHYETAVARAGAITPVPGGVGPMTIACLLANTVTACCRANGRPAPEELGL